MFMPACFGARLDSNMLEDTINDVLGIGARLFNTRLVGVSRIEGTLCTVMGVIDQQRQVRYGTMLPLEDTFCVEMLEHDGPYQIDNVATRSDADKFYAHPLGMPLFAYMGAPLRLQNGRVFGSLWAAHHQPHLFSAADLRMLSLLARLLAHELECSTAQQHDKRIEQVMATQAQIDPLTGLFSSDGFMNAIAEEASWRHSFPHAYTLAAVGLNIHTPTKAYTNVAHQGLADILMRIARLIDYCGRLDDRSYAVLFPNTSLGESKAWEQRLHAEIDAWNRVHRSVGLTFDVSVGMADSNETPGWGQSGTSVLQRARERMLAANRTGRAA